MTSDVGQRRLTAIASDPPIKPTPMMATRSNMGSGKIGVGEQRRTGSFIGRHAPDAQSGRLMPSYDIRDRAFEFA